MWLVNGGNATLWGALTVLWLDCVSVSSSLISYHLPQQFRFRSCMNHEIKAPLTRSFRATALCLHLPPVMQCHSQSQQHPGFLYCLASFSVHLSVEDALQDMKIFNPTHLSALLYLILYIQHDILGLRFNCLFYISWWFCTLPCGCFPVFFVGCDDRAGPRSGPTMPVSSDEPICPKFQPNIFDPSRCHDCLRQRHLHAGAGDSKEAAPQQKSTTETGTETGTESGIVLSKGVLLTPIPSQAEERDTSSKVRKEERASVEEVGRWTELLGNRVEIGTGVEYVLSDGISRTRRLGRKVSAVEVTGEVSKTVRLDVKSVETEWRRGALLDSTFNVLQIRNDAQRFMKLFRIEKCLVKLFFLSQKELLTQKSVFQWIKKSAF